MEPISLPLSSHYKFWFNLAKRVSEYGRSISIAKSDFNSYNWKVQDIEGLVLLLITLKCRNLPYWIKWIEDQHLIDYINQSTWYDSWVWAVSFTWKSVILLQIQYNSWKMQSRHPFSEIFVGIKNKCWHNIANFFK